MSKDKKKLIVIAALFAALLIGLLVVIVIMRDREVIAKAENTYHPIYESYCSYEHDKDISIDGKLEESVWKNKKWFSNTYLANTNGTMPVLKLTAFSTEYGVYIASVVEDTNLVSDGQRSPGMNSNWELYVTADNVGEVRKNDMLYRRQFNIDMTGDAYTIYTNFDRAVVVDGKLNSGSTKSATLEMFVPWQTLGIDVSKGIPKDFRVMPAYRGVLEGQTSTSLLQPVNFPIASTKDYYAFDNSGYINLDREGAIVGDSKFGNTKTANWDISKEAEGVIQSSIGTEHHKIFFTEDYGENFIVETTMIPVRALENDWPKAGILFQGTDGLYTSVLMDMNDGVLTNGKNGTKNFAKYQFVTIDNEGGKWNQRALSDCVQDNANASKKEGVKLTVIKLGGKFWYFADGNFITAQDKAFMDIEVIPGFYSLGGDVIYKDYSCKVITKDEVVSYLNERNLYMVDVAVASAGGSVVSSKTTVKKGESYELTITSNSGYEVSSVLINGEERINDVKKNASEGIYTVTNTKSNQDVKVKFAKCDGHKFSGQVKGAGEYLGATILLTGQTNKALRYEVSATGEKGFAVVVPAGTYKVLVKSDNYKASIDTVKISGDTVKNYTLNRSSFPEKVTVNGKEVKSLLSNWDLSKEYLGTVSTSYAKGGKIAPLYFENTGSDFVLEATINYTTKFEGGKEYQSDLMGGFVFNDGTNSAWIMARGTGVVHTGWKYVNNLIDYNAITYPDAKAVQFAIAKVGDKVNLYFNGELATVMDWATIAPKISSKSTMALGLYMVADKTADIEFSKYSVRTGTSAATSYINSHALQDKTLAANPLFSEVLTVNGVKIKSLLNRWDLTNVGNNVITGSYAMESKLKPLYFTSHGNTALMKTTIEYTTEFKAGETYQPDLMGGFTFSDGKNTGFIVACGTGITYTGWKQDQGLIGKPVLTYPEKRSVELTVALKNGYMYVFMNDEYVAKKKVSKIVTGANAGTDLAIGLTMVADKKADIRFTNTSISTDLNVVDTYISQHR